MFGDEPSPLKLDGLAVARAFFAGCMRGREPESKRLWVAFLDNAAHCLDVREYPYKEGEKLPVRSILADAKKARAKGILLAHRHDSQVEVPLESEKESTRVLSAAAEAIDCTIVDHLVFAGRRSMSMRQQGIL